MMVVCRVSESMMVVCRVSEFMMVVCKGELIYV